MMTNLKISLWLSVVSFKSPHCCGLWGAGSHCGEMELATLPAFRVPIPFLLFNCFETEDSFPEVS